MKFTVNMQHLVQHGKILFVQPDQNGSMQLFLLVPEKLYCQEDSAIYTIVYIYWTMQVCDRMQSISLSLIVWTQYVLEAAIFTASSPWPQPVWEGGGGCYSLTVHMYHTGKVIINIVILSTQYSSKCVYCVKFL